MSTEEDIATCMAAARQGKIDTVLEFLSDGKVAPGSIDVESGDTLLSIAAMTKNRELLEALVKVDGVDPHEPVMGETGDPIAFMCVDSGKLDVLKLFVETCGKEVLHDKNSAGETIMHKAVMSVKGNNTDVIKWLLENGCADQLNAGDSYGNSVLATVIMRKGATMEIVELLLNAGADINMINEDDGSSCLHVCSADNTDVIATLVQSGKCNTILAHKNNDGKTPVERAEEQYATRIEDEQTEEAEKWKKLIAVLKSASN